MANVIGPDVSFYQDNPGTSRQIDFTKMKEKAGYVIIRAGQNLWVDSDFGYNWLNAKAAGIPRGSYWFYDSRAEPIQQADLWYSQIANDPGELPLFADLEENYGGQYKGWRYWYTFITRLKSLIGGRQEIGIYTGYYYWLENAPNKQTEPVELEYFHQFPLWIAHYGVTTPSVPGPWSPSEWVFWQYTDKGDGGLYGVESLNIDLNYFHGDLATLKARFKLDGTNPGDGGGNSSTWYKVTAAALYVREGPSTKDRTVGTLYRNDIVEGIATSADSAWIKVRRYSDGLTGWSSRSYLIITIPPPTPPPVDPPPTSTGWYKVNAASLNVREGPGTSYKSLGTLKRNEVVEELSVSADGAWIKIKRYSDGLIGWASKTYLVITPVPSPLPTDPPPTDPPPSTSKWYKVNASALNVREGPGTSYKSLGTVKRNEVVEEQAVSADGAWIKIKRYSDELIGWASKTYLVLTPAPSPLPSDLPA